MPPTFDENTWSAKTSVPLSRFVEVAHSFLILACELRNWPPARLSPFPQLPGRWVWSGVVPQKSKIIIRVLQQRARPDDYLE